MASEQTKTGRRHYAVFISYRHADNKEPGRQWGNWLHQVLESYEVPSDLVGTADNMGGRIPASLYPVFRDEEELPADADLTKNIKQALENSSLLVVLCSPRAVESHWVADEIRYFKEIGKAGRILALMIDGSPNASTDPGKAKLGIPPEAECLPEPLRFGKMGDDGKLDWAQRAEPIAADVRPEGGNEQGWTTSAAYREALHKRGGLDDRTLNQKAAEYEQCLELAKLKVVAGALGVALGDLTRRDKALQLRKARARARALRIWLGVVGLLAILAVAGGVYAWSQRQAAIAQQNVAEAAEKEAKAQRLVAQTEKEAALKTAGSTDYAIACLKLEKKDYAASLAYLAESLRNDPTNGKAITLAVALIRSQYPPIAIVRSGKEIESVNYSPDGTRFATASEDKTARVWDAQTGAPVTPPLVHDGVVLYAAFSPDGQQLVTGSRDNKARIWDVRTGTLVGHPLNARNWVRFAKFSPDGRLIVTASNRAQSWDARTQKPVGRAVGFARSISDLNFSPDGGRVVSASWDGTAVVFDPQTGTPIGHAMKHDEAINSASFSPDGKIVVTTSNDSTARLWDSASGNPVGDVMKHENLLDGADFNQAGNLLVTAAKDKTSRIWDAHSGAAVSASMRQEDVINSARFSPEGARVVTASDDKTARIWSIANAKVLGYPISLRDRFKFATFSPDGKDILTSSTDNTVRIWGARTNETVEQTLLHGGFVTAASFSADGKWILTASGNTAEIWDREYCKSTGIRMNHGTALVSATFSPDGKRVLTCSAGSVQIWDAATGNPQGTPIIWSGRMNSASFSPDGKWVAAGADDDLARVWDAQSLTPVGLPVTHYGKIGMTSFSSDSQLLVTVGDGFNAQIWFVQTGKPKGQPIESGDGTKSACFSPDGHWVATTSNEAAGRFFARVWDAETGQPVGRAMSHNQELQSVVFSPDGRRLVTASRDKTAQVWDAMSGIRVGLPMTSVRAIYSARFSPDGNWVLTVDADNAARIWDAATGLPAGLPMQLAESINSAEFSPDSKSVVTASDDETARIWDVVYASDRAPPWLSDLAEVTAGQYLSPKGILEPSTKDPAIVRKTLLQLQGNDDLSRLGRWLVSDPSSRSIGPLSSLRTSDIVKSLIARNSIKSLFAAFEIDPGNPEVLVALARSIVALNRSGAQVFLELALHDARVSKSPDQIAKVEQAADSLFPEIHPFGGAPP